MSRTIQGAHKAIQSKRALELITARFSCKLKHSLQLQGTSSQTKQVLLKAGFQFVQSCLSQLQPLQFHILHLRSKEPRGRNLLFLRSFTKMLLRHFELGKPVLLDATKLYHLRAGLCTQLLQLLPCSLTLRLGRRCLHLLRQTSGLAGSEGSQLATPDVPVEGGQVRRKQLPDSWPRMPVDDELQSERLPIHKCVRARAPFRRLGAELERRIGQELDREVRERAHQMLVRPRPPTPFATITSLVDPPAFRSSSTLLPHLGDVLCGQWLHLETCVIIE